MYGIKIVRQITEDGAPTHIEYWMKTISEHTHTSNVKLLTFESIEDAEIYAQNHELSLYVIEKVELE